MMTDLFYHAYTPST